MHPLICLVHLSCLLKACTTFSLSPPPPPIRHTFMNCEDGKQATLDRRKLIIGGVVLPQCLLTNEALKKRARTGMYPEAFYTNVRTTFQKAISVARTSATTPRVLEIGAGNGHSVLDGHAYNKIGAIDLTISDVELKISPATRDKIRAQVEGSVRFVEADVDALPFESGEFDVVLSSLCLCSVRDHEKAIGEIKRVLTPSGTFGMVEHVLAEDTDKAFQISQKILSPLQQAVAGGCHLDRETGRVVEKAGFEVVNTSRYKLDDMWPVSAQLSGVYLRGGASVMMTESVEIKLTARTIRFALLASVPLLSIFQTTRTLPSMMYSILYNHVPIVHSPMFEAYLASTGFALAIVFWSSLHLLVRPKKRFDFYRKFRISGKSPTNTFEWLGLSGFKPFVDSYVPLFVYLAAIAVFHTFVRKPSLPFPHDHSLTIFRYVSEVLFGIFSYDIIFSLIHRLLHHNRVPWFIRQLHSRHHRKRAGDHDSLLPIMTVQHSWWDGFLQVLVNIIVQKFPGKHPLSKFTHNLLVTYLLVESHSGWDKLPFMSHVLFPKMLGGSVKHQRHHEDGGGDYHQFLNI